MLIHFIGTRSPRGWRSSEATSITEYGSRRRFALTPHCRRRYLNHANHLGHDFPRLPLAPNAGEGTGRRPPGTDRRELAPLRRRAEMSAGAKGLSVCPAGVVGDATQRRHGDHAAGRIATQRNFQIADDSGIDRHISHPRPISICRQRPCSCSFSAPHKGGPRMVSCQLWTSGRI